MKTAHRITIVLDEAHKYLTNSGADRFNQSICSIIRQQRHLAARAIISTQEPTVVPSSMLDLMSYIICHRFSSPSWVRHLRGHISTHTETTIRAQSWDDAVIDLETREALLFSGSAYALMEVANLSSLVVAISISSLALASLGMVGSIEESSGDATGSGCSPPGRSC